MYRDRITARYDRLSPSYRRIADFLLRQPLDAVLMSARELAARLEVDPAAVVRFSQAIGYTGHRQMIRAVRDVIKEELAAFYTLSLDGVGDDVDLFQRLLENERRNLALARDRLTAEANAILPALLGARSIIAVGQGRCASLAELCASALRDAGLTAVAVASDPLEAAESLGGVDPGDVVIGFSLTGMDLGVADAIRLARRRGARTLAFSGSDVAPAALAAETTVVCPGPTEAGVPSFAGLAAMVAVLAAALAARDPEGAAARAADLKESYRELLDIQAESASRADAGEVE